MDKTTLSQSERRNKGRTAGRATAVPLRDDSGFAEIIQGLIGLRNAVCLRETKTDGTRRERKVMNEHRTLFILLN